ncbi:DEAD/DEAH box helicase [Photobacterium aquae]|uniref:DEAD/DEAH box helicase n=1 Tax=Photobacterium aquae TaxID=1195763 RepID=A0A0J1GVU2_9GAMM|nr:DEAD/DEAH box helicase [Photobacterium aquae]KLV03838.1 DEAD/DEAH box helicase [Photobacterium aquae]
MPFSSLNLSAKLVAALPSQFKTPTEIQTLAIPAILANNDVLALAQTGTGKTFAYGLPLLESAALNAGMHRAVVMVPTRELAIQVSAALASVAHNMNLRVMALCGGVDKAEQLELLSAKPEILVATPGRLLDLLNDGAIETDGIDKLVFDEADRLLEMGFWPDVQRILALLPAKRQSLMFSATLPEQLEQIVANVLHKPAVVKAHVANSVVEQIEERLYLVNKGSKTQALITLIEQQGWEQVLVFIGARDNADALCKKLTKAGISVAALHGDKSQGEREQVLADFKDKKVQVLIATDLLARGIHVERLPVVVNFELPANPSVYVHRVGRTARAGENGLAVSLVCHGESEYLAAIRQMVNRELPLQALAGFPVTDKPSTGESKRPKRDKQANRRTARKTSAKQFQVKKNKR